MAGAKTLFFGSKLKVVVAVVGLLSASVGGAWALGIVGVPGVVAVENRFTGVSDTATQIQTDLVVNNPNPINLQLGGTSVEYDVAMNDVSIASGQKEGLNIDRGNTTLQFETQMDNEKIPAWWVTHIQNNETTNVNIDATVHSSLLGRSFNVPQSQQVNTNLIGQFNSDETRRIDANQALISDPVLYINQTSAEWGTVTQQKTPIDLRFKMYNPKLTPYTITELGYTVTMNGITVGEGTTDRSYVIPGGATETVQTKANINNQLLDDWWASHLRNDQVSELRIDFYAKVQLGQSGPTVRLPLDQLTHSQTVETDIFGTKDQTDIETNASSDTSAGDGAQSTTTDGTTTSESEATTATEETTTSQPTTTEDGGILDLPLGTRVLWAGPAIAF
ncbi:LEA type 2 family protein [Haladaptatus sp. DYSN1]|uniref:LEA type 2 family protein n=1 Tax=unclassified Haladaptatus TaxID=2622732 RepID=UPI002405F93F|nr:LEA type 2 family protein [Haladaptatus sp. DYSN1]